MVRWTLALPLDLSPAEEQWFSEQLASLAEVAVSWIGRTQLESELSRHRDLLRAFAPGSTERRAMDLLAAYQAEQAGLAQGMADAIPRLVILKEQLDVVDPDWAFDVQMAGSNVDIRLRPKDADALRRRPIGLSLAIGSANDTAVEEAVERFLKYGRPVDIPSENILAYAVELPGNLNQVVAEGGLVSVALSQGNQDDSWRLSQRIEAHRNGRVVDVLPVEWTERSAGPLGGAWLCGRDRSGFLELVLRVEPDRTIGGMDIRAPASDDVLPEDAAPVMRFLSVLRSGDELRMSGPDIPPTVMRLTGPPTGDPESVAVGAIIAETLARIQKATGTRFPLPRAWTRQDSEMLYFCDQLLAVGQVQWYWPGYAVNLPALRLAKLLSDSTIPRVSMTGESGDNPEVALMSDRITISGKIRCEVTDMVVMNPRQLRVELESVGPLAMLPVPLGQDDRTRSMFYLISEPEVDEANGALASSSLTS